MKVIEWFGRVWNAFWGRPDWLRARIRIRVRNQTWWVDVKHLHCFIDQFTPGQVIKLEFACDKDAKQTLPAAALPWREEFPGAKPIEGARKMLLDSPMGCYNDAGEEEFERLQDVLGLDNESPMRYLSPEQQDDHALHMRLVQKSWDKRRKDADED